MKELLKELIKRKYREIKYSTTDGRNYIIAFIVYDIGKISLTFVDDQSTTGKAVIEAIDNCVTAYKTFGMTLVPNRKRPSPIDASDDEDGDDY